MNQKRIYLIIGLLSLFLVSNKYTRAQDNNTKTPCHTIVLTGTNVSCNGGTNGTAQISISGGSGNFSISWSNGAINVNSISNLTAGYYDVYVIDTSTGCNAFALINITQPQKLSSSIVVENVSCFGELTGDVLLNVVGGTLPYNYVWSNSVFTQNNLNISAGNYGVTITDSKGCTTTNSATVTQPNQALGSSYTIKEVLCNNQANGAIDVSTWGGTPPYTYNWNSNTYNSQDLLNIPSGIYNLLIEDIKHCQKSHSITISNPPVLQMTDNVTNNNCFGIQEGTINLSVSGGISPYTYSWSDSEFLLSYNTPFIDSLPNENYFVIVKDKNGCVITDDFKITSPTEITTEIVGTHVSSFGGSDGQIDLSVSGGVPSYSYVWSNGVNTQDNINVVAGLYEVTITDQHNCSANTSIIILEPLEPLSFSFISKDVSCNAGSDGEIFTYATGGVEPYTYKWSSGSTLPYITDLHAGSYILTLTDANAIEFIDTINIYQPDPFIFSSSTIEPNCFGFSDGSINLNVTGGRLPYKFQWYNHDYVLACLTQDLIDKQSGDYTVKIVDTMGCVGYYTVRLNEPEKLEVSIQKDDVLCSGDSTGSIFADVTGGIEPYNYQWSSNQTTQSITYLYAGNYGLIVHDENGCIKSVDTEITEPDPITIELSPFEVSCIDQSDGYIESFVYGGSGNYQYEWINVETTADIYNLNEGDYTLNVTDIYGCKSEKSTTVLKNDSECISIPSTFSPNGDGINDEWIIKNILLYPDCKIKVFSNWGRIVFESNSHSVYWDGTYNGNVLPSGTYYYILNLNQDLAPYKGAVTIVK